LSDQTGELGCFGYVLLGLSYLIIFVTLPFSLCFTTKVIAEYERAVIFRLGRILRGGARGPGLFFIIPCMDRVRKVDLRTVTFDVPPQEVIFSFAQFVFDVVMSLSDQTGELGCFGYVLLGLSYLIIFVTLPFSLCFTTKVIAEYERAVIFRLGRILRGGARGPGLFFIIPCMDRVRKVDLRTVTFDVPPQEVIFSFAQFVFDVVMSVS
ncbi:hypothetical protein AHF37_08049, partial [Paragonimus kellicotti]